MALYKIYSDEQLLQLLHNGDDMAFTEVYNRYWEQLFAIGYNYCHQKETAEEIVQDVFMSLWERRRSLEINDLPAYLATACKYSVFKYLLQKKRRQMLLEQHTTPVININEEETIHARFLREYINGIVEKLPDQCKVVFQYSREKNLSIPEIARELKISPKTVESHLSKALRTLRFSLKAIRLWMLLASWFIN